MAKSKKLVVKAKLVEADGSPAKPFPWVAPFPSGDDVFVRARIAQDLTVNATQYRQGTIHVFSADFAQAHASALTAPE